MKIEKISEITIGDLYDVMEQRASTTQIKEIKKDKFIITSPLNLTTPSVSKNLKIENNKLLNIMKHTTEKHLFRIDVDNKEVVVTKDHSCIVLRNSELIEVRPEDILKTDIFVVKDGDKLKFCKDFIISELGKTVESVYDIEVEKNHNFFGNDILVHNSGYISFAFIAEKILEDNFGIKDYDKLDEIQKKQAIELFLKFIEDEIQPIIDGTVEYVSKHFNAFKKGFMGAKVEKIVKKGFWTAKKRYALLVIFDEGSFKIKKEKIATTGLETIKSQTPNFAVEILTEAIDIILKGSEVELQDFLSKQKEKFLQMTIDSPASVCETVKINNLTYSQDSKGFYRINETGRRIGAPMNSKGGMAYNTLLSNSEFKEFYTPIEEGMKCYIAKLKIPNIVNSDVIAYLDDEFLRDTKLDEKIDSEYLWEKHIFRPLTSIMKSVEFQLIKSASCLDDW